MNNSTVTFNEVLEGLETKEGLILLISQMINDNPNDQELGREIRDNFENYFFNQE